MPCSTSWSLERRRHVGDRPHDDVAAIAARRARRRRVEAEAKPSRAAQRNRIRSVKVLAHLQPRHAVGAVDVIDDLAEFVIVHRALGDLVVLAVNTHPHRMAALEGDARRFRLERPHEQPIETRRMTAGLFDPAQIPTLGIRPSNAGGADGPVLTTGIGLKIVEHRPLCPRRSLRTAGPRLPAARIGLQAGLIGDADGGVADVQAVTSALHRGVLEGETRLFDKPGAQQHPVAGHADDIALEAA